MRYIIFSWISVLFFLNQSLGQDTLQKKHLVFKIAPLAMIDVDNTFQIATEHRLSGKRWTLSEEFGYGTGAASLWGESFGNSGSGFRENFRTKIEARKYKEAFTGKYIAYELFYKQINDRNDKSIGRECESGRCNYYENINYLINKYVLGITAKVGYQIRIRNELKKNTNFVFDFYVGAGLRRIMINHHDGNESSTDRGYYGNGLFNNSGLGYSDTKYNIPHLALGIKIGYIVY